MVQSLLKTVSHNIMKEQCTVCRSCSFSHTVTDTDPTVHREQASLYSVQVIYTAEGTDTTASRLMLHFTATKLRHKLSVFRRHCWHWTSTVSLSAAFHNVAKQQLSNQRCRDPRWSFETGWIRHKWRQGGQINWSAAGIFPIKFYSNRPEGFLLSNFVDTAKKPGVTLERWRA